MDDRDGGVIICDLENGRIRRLSAVGMVSTIAGGMPSGRLPTATPWNTGDARGTAACFNFPHSCVVAETGIIYVSEWHRIRAIRGGVVRTLAGSLQRGPCIDGRRGGDVRFHMPGGLVLLDAWTLVVADTQNNVLRRVALVDRLAVRDRCNEITELQQLPTGLLPIIFAYLFA